MWRFRGRYHLLLEKKPGKSWKGGSNGGWFDAYCGVFQVGVAWRVTMDELLRLAFVSTGTFAILAYLAYVACTEGAFNQKR
jgi:hypothetical protein